MNDERMRRWHDGTWWHCYGMRLRDYYLSSSDDGKSQFIRSFPYSHRFSLKRPSSSLTSSHKFINSSVFRQTFTRFISIVFAEQDEPWPVPYCLYI
jgi:hypothetical protein